MRKVALGLGVTIALVVACDGSEEHFGPCLPGQLPAIEVVVVDASTQEQLSGRASGLVTNGERTDSLRVCQRDHGQVLSRCGMYGFGGTFYVMVVAPEYQAWDTTGVVVPFGRCGNPTAHLDVALKRFSSRR